MPPGTDSEDDPRLATLLSLFGHLPERIVYLSTSGVYGNAGGELVDEIRTPAPATKRARRRLAAVILLTD